MPGGGGVSRYEKINRNISHHLRLNAMINGVKIKNMGYAI